MNERKIQCVRIGLGENGYFLRICQKEFHDSSQKKIKQFSHRDLFPIKISQVVKISTSFLWKYSLSKDFSRRNFFESRNFFDFSEIFLSINSKLFNKKILLNTFSSISKFFKVKSNFEYLIWSTNLPSYFFLQAQKLFE